MRTGSIAVLLAALCVAGCNTVTRGTKEQVTINTRPTGAKVTTSLGQSCPRSPCTFEVKRRTPFDAYATKPGYRQGQVHVASKIGKEGVRKLAGNLIFPGGSAGLAVDLVTGAARDHTPNPALIVLTPEKGKVRSRSGKAPTRRRGAPVS